MFWNIYKRLAIVGKKCDPGMLDLSFFWPKLVKLRQDLEGWGKIRCVSQDEESWDKLGKLIQKIRKVGDETKEKEKGPYLISVGKLGKLRQTRKLHRAISEAKVHPKQYLRSISWWHFPFSSSPLVKIVEVVAWEVGRGQNPPLFGRLFL